MLPVKFHTFAQWIFSTAATVCCNYILYEKGKTNVFRRILETNGYGILSEIVALSHVRDRSMLEKSSIPRSCGSANLKNVLCSEYYVMRVKFIILLLCALNNNCSVTLLMLQLISLL